MSQLLLIVTDPIHSRISPELVVEGKETDIGEEEKN